VKDREILDKKLQEARARLSARYAEGNVPWDDPVPPPEVIEIAAKLSPGRALDLGCGYGRSSIYLAALGWEVDAVDFIEEAIEVAAARAKEAGVSIRFHQGSITDLSFLDGPYDFALDVGCCHILDEEGLQQYKDQLVRLLAPGAVLLIYARCHPENSDEEEGFSGLRIGLLEEVLGRDFQLDWAEPGETHLPDGDSWPSAWYQFRRI
jgi:SAM-dependent methyltransferase